MLENTITLNVDTQNNGTISQEQITLFDRNGNRSLYHGSGNSVTLRKHLNFYRSFPKKTGNFNGVSKTSIKWTHDVNVPTLDGSGNVTAPLIVEVNFSIPVGTPAAEVLLLRQRTIAILDNDSVMNKFNNDLHI